MATLSKPQIEGKIAEFKEFLATAGIPADEKAFAEKQLEKFEKQLESAGAAPSQGKKKGRPKSIGEKPKKTYPNKNKNLEKITVTIGGEKVKLSEADCWQVASSVAERITKSKAAGKKYRTKPVTEKTGDTLEVSAKHVEDAVTTQRIEKNPDEVLAGAKLMEEGYEKLFEGFEKMTGKKIPADTRKQIMDIIAGIKDEAKEAKK